MKCGCKNERPQSITVPACPLESIFNHGDLVFWEAWGEEKGEILFLPLFLKAVYSSCLIPLSPGRSHAFPWVPTTASCLPFVSAQCSTGRKPAEMGSTIKTHFNIFPTQLPGPVARSESFGFEPT